MAGAQGAFAPKAARVPRALNRSKGGGGGGADEAVAIGMLGADGHQPEHAAVGEDTWIRVHVVVPGTLYTCTSICGHHGCRAAGGGRVFICKSALKQSDATPLHLQCGRVGGTGRGERASWNHVSRRGMERIKLKRLLNFNRPAAVHVDPQRI